MILRAILSALLVLPGFAERAPAAPVKPPKVPSVSGTTWTGTGPDGNTHSYAFEENGVLVYTSFAGNVCRNCEWTQTGASISFKINGYSEFEGKIGGDTMEGSAKNSAGLEWEWKFTKQK